MLMSVFVVFQFPISVIIVIVSVVFLGAKPISNPEGKSFVRLMIDVLCSVLWIGLTTTIICGFFFGTLVS